MNQATRDTDPYRWRGSVEARFLAGFGVLVGGYATVVIVSKLLGYIVTFGFAISVTLMAYVWACVSFRESRGLRPPGKVKQMRFARQPDWKAALEKLAESQPIPQPVFSEAFLLSDAIDGVLEYVMRDFVLKWYRSFSTDTAFPAQVDAEIRHALMQLGGRAQNVNWPTFLVTKVLPVVTDHFMRYVEADAVVRDRSGNRRLTESKELDQAVAIEYGRLHEAVDVKSMAFSQKQTTWLMDRVDGMLPLLLKRTSAESKIVRTLVRDIVACSVLTPVLRMLCDADFWNQLVVKNGQSTLQDQRRVDKLRRALDKHTGMTIKKKSTLWQGGSGQSGSESAKPIKLAPEADQHDYERFLREIRGCKLPQARQVRYYISVQLQRLSRQPRPDSLYRHRLVEGKKTVEARIAELSGATSVSSSAATATENNDATAVPAHDARKDYDLEDVLGDANCLSFFMEYMDRRRHIALLQFYLAVDGLAIPRDEIEEKQSVDPLGGMSIIMPAEAEEEQHTESVSRSDIILIYEMYFKGSGPGASPKSVSTGSALHISQTARDAVEDYVRASKPDHTQYQRALRAVVDTQAAVFESMRARDLAGFKRSELFLKFLALSVPREQAKTAVSVDALQLDSVDQDGTTPDFAEIEDGAQALTAVEEALSNIMEERPGSSSAPPESEASADEFDTFSSGGSQVLPSVLRGRPNGSTTPERIASPRRISSLIFESGSEADTNGDNGGDADDMDLASSLHEELHVAAPGDLGLTEAISILSDDIDRLHQQDDVIKSLLRKAEITNNVPELRVLRKSHASLEREIQQKELQRQQYVVQESENSLYGRSDISIPSYVNTRDEAGGEYTMYIIEVRRTDLEGSVSAGWIVGRRYTQFLRLHQHLRTQFPELRSVAFPRKRVVLKLQQRFFVESRRAALERYLQTLLSNARVCQSREFRMFLSSETFAFDAVPDRPSIPDRPLSPAGVTDEPAGWTVPSQASPGHQPPTDNVVSRGGSDAIDAETEQAQLYEQTRMRPFVQPICDLFIQVFGLDSSDNWLRGRAIIVVLQQLLGGTIEKKIRDAIGGVTGEKGLTDAVQLVRDAIWPGGSLKPPAQPRSPSDKIKSRHDARILLEQLFRGSTAKIVGSASARYAAGHVFGIYQNDILNTHLVLTLFDLIVDEVLGTPPPDST